LSSRLPRSTYRLQFQRSFDFRQGRFLVGYLSRLGISDCYSSPSLASRASSPHGYDICDHGRLDEELGTEADFDAFVAELSRHDMGLILDFVPNHMAADPRANRWWRDVLANGPRSPFARFFDIDWSPTKPELRDKVLLPVLGDLYGVALERGEIQLAHEDGAFVLRYFDHSFPLEPRSVELVVGRGGESAGVEEILRVYNGHPGEPRSFDRLHELLERQAYRLAYWKAAFHEINYRRFFDINDLVGLRMEDPAVFDVTHALVLRWIRDRKLAGLRLDHIDGLFDPRGYLEKLRDAAGSIYLVAEKILSTGESLPRSWPIHGTTGYDFLNDVNGLFVDPRGERIMKSLYERFTGRGIPFPIEAYVAKKLITSISMASELNVLAQAVNRISETDRRSRDFTLESLGDALREVVACFPVYRTYLTSAECSEEDRSRIETAVARAQRRNPSTEPSIFDFLRASLLPSPALELVDPAYPERLAFAMKFQQYTGPVQAKGLEDTAFYRHNVLASLNEVGGDPQRFGRSPVEFHEQNRRRLALWPYSMLATSTHDTKRGEDARARLNVLSEIPREWGAAVWRWSRTNAPNRTRIDGDWAPHRNDEYLFYQALLGVWPAASHTAVASPELAGRLSEYVIKAAKEAKLHTSWISDNKAYDDALVAFVEKSLRGRRSERFLSSFLPFQERVARAGMVNSLAQLALKICSPGVPDFYQGTELWDLTLVDPDNRRPVDFSHRRRLLEAMEPLLAPGCPPNDRRAGAAEMIEHWPDGRIKMWITARALDLRNRRAALFLAGEYRPLEAVGERGAHVVSFARRNAGETLIVVVPRLAAKMTRSDHPLPLGEASWGLTALSLPADLRPPGGYEDVLTGVRFVPDDGLRIADLLRTLPVALLHGGAVS
jgi:(1->4)-alpha-D-glucan 1-alpha-D-glucosylmutase